MYQSRRKKYQRHQTVRSQLEYHQQHSHGRLLLSQHSTKVLRTVLLTSPASLSRMLALWGGAQEGEVALAAERNHKSGCAGGEGVRYPGDSEGLPPYLLQEAVGVRGQRVIAVEHWHHLHLQQGGHGVEEGLLTGVLQQGGHGVEEGLLTGVLQQGGHGVEEGLLTGVLQQGGHGVEEGLLTRVLQQGGHGVEEGLLTGVLQQGGHGVEEGLLTGVLQQGGHGVEEGLLTGVLPQVSPRQQHLRQTPGKERVNTSCMSHQGRKGLIPHACPTREGKG